MDLKPKEGILQAVPAELLALARPSRRRLGPEPEPAASAGAQAARSKRLPHPRALDAAERRRARAPRDAVARGPTREWRRCDCGQCTRCLEDARWERIFQERFADPAYYAGVIVHRRSPLTGM
jgi:hypothetical protein